MAYQYYLYNILPCHIAYKIYHIYDFIWSWSYHSFYYASYFIRPLGYLMLHSIIMYWINIKARICDVSLLILTVLIMYFFYFQCSICSYQLNLWYVLYWVHLRLVDFWALAQCWCLHRLCHGSARYCSTSGNGPPNPIKLGLINNNK